MDPASIDIRWKEGEGLNTPADAQNARDYFIEWSGEGGLTEAFNQSLQASLSLNVILTDSGNDNGQDFMELTVYPGWRQPSKKHK